MVRFVAISTFFVENFKNTSDSILFTVSLMKEEKVKKHSSMEMLNINMKKHRCLFSEKY